MSVTIPLRPGDFPDLGCRPVAHAGALVAEAFRYPTGVEALRLRAGRAEAVVLPFMGQQIWRAAFDGREVTMGSAFEAPVPGVPYLQTYGAFFIHCGLLRIGPPSAEDPHPLHGELPLARFETAEITIDPAARRIALGGLYRHRTAFGARYAARAEVALSEGQSALEVAVAVENARADDPLEIMYLGHANFRPVDGARLCYAARYTPEDVRVRRDLPAHVPPAPGLRAFVERLARDPAAHHLLAPDLPFAPEVVLTIRPCTDAAGWSHAMQLHPDGNADFISHDARALPVVIRWISRGDGREALGLALPATAGVEGHAAERAAGRMVTLPPGGRWSARMRMGTLRPPEAGAFAAMIEHNSGRG